MAMHTDGDGQNFVEALGEYARLVDPARLTAAVVREQTPTHCGFSEAELLSGWRALVGWIEGGAQPSVNDLRRTCKELSRTGAAAGPCRHDRRYEFGRLADRVPPR